MQEPAPPIPSEQLTTRQAILIGSRLFAAYLLFWAAVDVLELPREIYSVLHYARAGTAVGLSLAGASQQSFLFRTYVHYLLANILRIALWLMIAGWFYRCGPRIREFLLSSGPDSIATSDSELR